MKNPLLILAIAALSAFTMGWFGHRVLINSQAPVKTPPQGYSLPEKKIESLPVLNVSTPLATTDSQLVQKETPRQITAKAYPDTTWDLQEMRITYADGTIKTFLTYLPKISFADFPARSVFKGKMRKALNFSACSSGKLYQKATQKAVSGGVNFAGQYALAIIPCGLGCWSSTLTDLKTGKVLAGPHAVTGYQFQQNSTLLLINPPDSAGYYEACEDCAPMPLRWTGTRFLPVKP